MIQAVTTCFKKYLTFSGRATRSEFWYFILFFFSVQIVLIVVNLIVFGSEETQFQEFNADGELIRTGTRTSYDGGILGQVFTLVTLIPWLAVGWRRMHDIGRPGYLPWLLWLIWILAVLVFVATQIGVSEMVTTLRATGSVRVEGGGFSIVMVLAYIGILLLNLYWLTRPSDPKENRYGPNPTEVKT